MKIKCLNCNDIIESKHVHDFVTCKCYKASEALYGAFRDVLAANRSKGINPTDSAALDAFYEVVFKGVALDGGDEYTKIIGDVKTVEFLNESI